jgi:hypothetical protein
MQLYLHASQSILLVREFLVAFFPLYYIFFWVTGIGILFLMVNFVVLVSGEKLKKDR